MTESPTYLDTPCDYCPDDPDTVPEYAVSILVARDGSGTAICPPCSARLTFALSSAAQDRDPRISSNGLPNFEVSGEIEVSQ